MGIADGPFPQLPSASIISYDWVDMNSGTGYVTFYGYSLKALDGSYTHHLNTNQFYSSSVETAANYDATGTPIDLDFDVHFNLPQIIKGDLWVETSIGKDSGNPADTIRLDLKVGKVPAVGAEVEVAHAYSSYAITSTENRKTVLIKAVVPETLYKAGETLRITPQIVIVGYTGDKGSCAITHDPMGRDGEIHIKPSTDASFTSVFKVNVPFKIKK